MNFLASPELVTAMSFSGSLDFNPMTDSLVDKDGNPFKFAAPSGTKLPANGFTPGDLAYNPTTSPEPSPETPIAISPTSDRLEVLAPFPSFFEAGPAELPSMKCLMRVRGKWSVPARSTSADRTRRLTLLARSLPFFQHDRPHLCRRALAQVQRSPQQHLGEPLCVPRPFRVRTGPPSSC